MEKYYLIYGRRLVKGVSSRDDLENDFFRGLKEERYGYTGKKIEWNSTCSD